MSLQAAALYATVSVAGADRSVRDLGRVSGAVDKTQRKLTVFGRSSQGIGKGLGQMLGGVARIAAITGAAVIAAGTAATVVAMNFEDAFANVKKTVEGTPAALNNLKNALKDLSTRIPVSFQDLAMIATEAGALDVAAEDVDNFTEAVARTTAATVGLDTALASEAFGKLGTIFALRGKDYERLGSVLVELGRSGASTEVDIIAVTKRFAAAGQQAGLSAAQVLGWSSALASLGPEAEAAGGALQRIFNRAQRNIGLMGEKGLVGKNARARVDAFARVSGLTVKEFVALYTKDASGAMEQFIAGLGKLDPAAQQREMFKAGIINQRDLLAFQSFVERYPILVKQLGMANKAWAEGTALVEVSTSRFDTLKSHLKELWNTVLLGADAFGEGLLPAIGRVAAKGKGLILAHMGDFRRFGQEVGAAIDRIDWTRVERGIGTVVDITKELLGLIKQIPTEVGVAFLGLVGIDKLAGGMLGRGAGNVVGGLFNQFLARGSSPANPMWVAGVGIGGKGLDPTDVVKVGGAGALAAASGVATVAALAALSAYAAVEGNNQRFGGKGLTEDEIRAIKWNEGNADWRYASTRAGYGEMPNQAALLASAMAKLNGTLRPVNSLSTLPSHIQDLSRAIHPLTGLPPHIQDLERKLDDNTKALRVPEKKEALSAYARSNKILGVKGPTSVATDTSIERRLRALGSNRSGGDLAAISHALTIHFLRTNAPVYRSMTNQQRSLEAMKNLQQRLLDRGDTKNAALIGQDIAKMEQKIKIGLDDVETQQRLTKAAIESMPGIPVNMYLDGQKIGHALIAMMGPVGTGIRGG